MTNARQCSATTKAGTPCRGRAQPGSDYCLAHDPERQAELAESRRQGGLAKSAANRARKQLLEAGDVTAPEMQALLGLVAKRLVNGRMAPSVANAMASVIRAWFAGRDTLLLEDVERRIAALEQAERGIQ